MARPGRKRKEGDRYPGGQIRPEDAGPSPTQTKRLMLASLAKMADREWSTVPGIHYLSGKISTEQYEAAKRFSALHEAYQACLLGPRRPYSSTGEKGSLGAPVDVESTAGEEEARRHVGVLQRYNDAHIALIVYGTSTESAVINFCAGLGQTPDGYEGLLRVRKGLDALAAIWKLTKK